MQKQHHGKFSMLTLAAVWIASCFVVFIISSLKLGDLSYILGGSAMQVGMLIGRIQSILVMSSGVSLVFNLIRFTKNGFSGEAFLKVAIYFNLLYLITSALPIILESSL